MAIQFAPIIAGISRLFASNVGRMASGSAGNVARSTSTFANATSRTENAKKGLKIQSNALDSFVKNQERLSKIQSKDTKQSLNYLKQFDRTFKNAASSSLSINKNLSPLFNNKFLKLAALISTGVAAKRTFGEALRSYGADFYRERLIGKTPSNKKVALKQLAKETGFAFEDLDYKLSQIAQTAGQTPGSNESILLQRLGLNPNNLQSMDSMQRINLILERMYSNRYSKELMDLSTQLTGLDQQTLMQLYKDKNKNTKTYNDRLKEISSFDIERLNAAELKRLELEDKVNNSFDKLAASITPVTNLFNELIAKLKIFIYETLANSINWVLQKIGLAEVQQTDAEKEISSNADKIRYEYNNRSNSVNALYNKARDVLEARKLYKHSDYTDDDRLYSDNERWAYKGGANLDLTESINDFSEALHDAVDDGILKISKDDIESLVRVHRVKEFARHFKISESDAAAMTKATRDLYNKRAVPGISEKVWDTWSFTYKDALRAVLEHVNANNRQVPDSWKMQTLNLNLFNNSNDINSQPFMDTVKAR